VKALISSLTIIGLVTYSLLRLAYSVFYDQLGLEPEDVGLGYGGILSQSITGLVFLVVLFALVGLVVIGVSFLIGLAAVLIVGILTSIVNSLLAKMPAGVRDWLTTPGPGNAYSIVLTILLAIAGIQFAWGYGGPIFVGLVERSALGSLLSAAQGFSSVVAQLPTPVLVLTPMSGIPWLLIAWNRYYPPREVHPIKPSIERGVAITGLVLIGLSTVAMFLAIAASDGEAVSRGTARHASVFGVRIAGWGGDPATVTWSSTAPQSSQAYGHDCLMYIGQVADTILLYDVTTQVTLRVSAQTATVALEGKRSSC
jgi:hypothetical protein